MSTRAGRHAGRLVSSTARASEALRQAYRILVGFDFAFGMAIRFSCHMPASTTRWLFCICSIRPNFTHDSIGGSVRSAGGAMLLLLRCWTGWRFRCLASIIPPAHTACTISSRERRNSLSVVPLLYTPAAPLHRRLALGRFENWLTATYRAIRGAGNVRHRPSCTHNLTALMAIVAEGRRAVSLVAALATTGDEAGAHTPGNVRGSGRPGVATGIRRAHLTQPYLPDARWLTHAGDRCRLQPFRHLAVAGMERHLSASGVSDTTVRCPDMCCSSWQADSSLPWGRRLRRHIQLPGCHACRAFDDRRREIVWRAVMP